MNPAEKYILISVTVREQQLNRVGYFAAKERDYSPEEEEAVTKLRAKRTESTGTGLIRWTQAQLHMNGMAEWLCWMCNHTTVC